MTPTQIAQWLTIAAMILAGGIWLGKLQQQVTDQKGRVDQQNVYFHGSVNPVPGAK